MNKDGYTSVYVSKELKRQLVEIARSQDYHIGCGRGSRLAEFIAAMLQEYSGTSQKDSVISTFSDDLSPELRHCVTRLSKMDHTQQKRACAMLNLLFDDQRSEQEQ